jgi:hypothetical protein
MSRLFITVEEWSCPGSIADSVSRRYEIANGGDLEAALQHILDVGKRHAGLSAGVMQIVRPNPKLEREKAEAAELRDQILALPAE